MNQPTARPRVVFNEEQNLADIRSRSCYKTLRFVINLGAWISLAVVSFQFLLLLKLFVMVGITISDTDTLLNVLIQIGGYVGAIILIIAARQMALLLVDIADTLISDHNRNRNR